MEKQMKKGRLFESEDFKIIMPDDSVYPSNQIVYLTEDQETFTLLFLLSHDINLMTEDGDIRFLFRKNQYILYYSSRENKLKLWSESHEPVKYLQIQVSHRYISKLINPETNKENEEIMEKMIRNQFLFLHKQTPPYMTVEMHLILNEIMTYQQRGLILKLFIEAKIIKLLILIFEQFKEKKIKEPKPEIPELIKRFIDENYHRNIKAEEIGKLIGVNQNNIRKEFKIQYHTTIANYMLELRMLKAKKLIVDKNIMIKEIAIECGYEYIQNFTRAFKKKFGVSPENLRNNK
ncbi:helix-turn-helix transcriptional regulator [Chryseobacterium sp. PMSZPI]|uniref:helix-turn-helix transcriptional regulator n=1 Tax=Chryseobacterium sp. PMSZPI TaxID=1033900 RepID=UPI000C339F96|nr:AraC family transcriptional regulator [Chryseobacterium sp. PMSZPI]PKF72920.1 hypothetical protein CW752_15140 [Chryseobacterium sp. PMSZPI]